MRKALIATGVLLLVLLSVSVHTLAQCVGDFDIDGDADGADVAYYIGGNTSISLENFAVIFGRTGCLVVPVKIGEIHPAIDGTVDFRKYYFPPSLGRYNHRHEQKYQHNQNSKEDQYERDFPSGASCLRLSSKASFGLHCSPS